MKKSFLMRQLAAGILTCVMSMPAFAEEAKLEFEPATEPVLGNEYSIGSASQEQGQSAGTFQLTKKQRKQLEKQAKAQARAEEKAQAQIEKEARKAQAQAEKEAKKAEKEAKKAAKKAAKEGKAAPAQPAQAPANQVANAETAEALVPNNDPIDIVPYVGKTITKQSITGSTVLTEEEILSVVSSKPGMEFTETLLAEDLNAIYSLGWYYDLRPEFKVVPEGVQLTYHVMENPVFKGARVTGNSVFNQNQIASLFNLEPNQVANLQEVNKCVAKMQELYRDAGYILARVSDVHMEKDGTLSVAVNEGLVEGFKVKGNKKCKDYVITREMKLEKGKPFNAKLARRSMQRVYNLGYFEDVNVKLNPGREPNSVEVEIDVVEQSTGTFGIGAGYSSADGFVGMISIGDRNFRGIGDSINLRWEFGGRDNKNYDFTYTRPWLDRHETKASINLYDITNEYIDYDIDDHEIARYEKKRRGQELTLSRRDFKNDFVTNYVTIKNRNDIYRGMADDYENPQNDAQYYEDDFQYYHPGLWQDYYPESSAERRAENFGVTRSLTFGRIFDSRDNIYDPHGGKRISYSFEWAGFMGGDFKYRKLTADYRYYWQVGKTPCVWALNLGAGWATGNMPLSQRFTMGGSDTLRGYEDNQFRGNSMAKATLEFRFPIVKKVQGVLFTDNGYAWDKRHEKAFDFGKTKSSVGLGMRINSPLGPIKLDYGWGRNGGKFHFSFGGQF